MSLPQNPPHVPVNVPSQSPSPSKSSLDRGTGGVRIRSSRSLLPSPYLDEPVIDATLSSPKLEVAELDEEPSQHVGDDSQQEQPTQPFQPFFTLIEDAITHEHFHPTVHYIFADDDADIITEAALRSLQHTETQIQESGTSEGLQHGLSGGQTHESYLPAVQPGVREHYLVVDVQASSAPRQLPQASLDPSASENVSGGSGSRTTLPAYEVTNAYSLSAEWQVLRTNVTHAPTMGDTDGDEGLMLRVEGRGGTPPFAQPQQEKEKEKESAEELIERFERGLQDVRLIMDAGRQAEGTVAEQVEASRRHDQ